MKRRILLMFCLVAFCFAVGFAESDVADSREVAKSEKQAKGEKKNRLTFGGYGEAVASYNFFSDNYLRYQNPALYQNARHGRFDLPHVVFFVGYDFGKGWSMATEIEFEHGGIEGAVEMEEEEGGEYETEIERGGEVALEQFWIQKSFGSAFNLRMGHIIVPVGGTNQHHMPTEFFGVYRPEGENTILPCTWHETGLSLWGVVGKWRYEALFMPGLDSDRFSRKNWINSGSGSPYEFKIGNAFAGAFRVDNYSVPGLRLSLSGYAGNSFRNTMLKPNSNYDRVKGTVAVGAFDFNYSARNLIVRGSFDYGHLSDSKEITIWNKNRRNDSPSPKQDVASDAISAGIEAGYDILAPIAKLKQKNQKLYVFARYDYYDSMFKTVQGVTKYEWCGRQRIAAGINYYPMKDIVIKGEYFIGMMRNNYNNEPGVSIGVAYAGFFTR